MHEGPARDCLRLGDALARLRPRYRRIALVSGRAHLAGLDRSDDQTLVVCCNWLIWQELEASMPHSIYIDAGLVDWDDADLPNDGQAYDSDWALRDGEDVTVFRGVPLGRLFATEVGMLVATYWKLEQALRSLLRRFRPDTLVFFDLRIDQNEIDVSARKIVVDTVCAELGVDVVDRSDPSARDDSDSPMASWRGGATGSRPNLLRRLALAVYLAVAGAAAGLMLRLYKNRYRVLLAVNTSISAPLLRAFRPGRTIPVVFARNTPDKMRSLIRHALMGIPMATLPPAKLDRNDQARLSDIKRDLAACWAGPITGLQKAVRNYLQTHVIGSGRFEQMAALVRRSERLFERTAPDRIVVDSVKGQAHRIYIEQAHRRGVAVDYIWHGPFALQNLRFEALGSDPRFPPRVTRMLSWGPVNDGWLDAVEARTERVTVGNPILDAYADPPAVAPADRRRALLLQYTPIITDLKGLNANQFEFFVETARMLREIGYDEIIVKLHPGLWRTDYYQRIAELFSLDVSIRQSEPFQELVDWADVVIGPAASGAMLETLASGKPYYAMLLPPHSLDTSYAKSVDFISSVDELRAALTAGRPIRTNEILDDYCSSSDIPSASRRLWQVFGDDAERGRGGAAQAPVVRDRPVDAT